MPWKIDRITNEPPQSVDLAELGLRHKLDLFSNRFLGPALLALVSMLALGGLLVASVNWIASLSESYRALVVVGVFALVVAFALRLSSKRKKQNATQPVTSSPPGVVK